MKNTEYKKATLTGKCKFILKAGIILIFIIVNASVSATFSQAVLFDFDNVPQYTPLPINITEIGITAHLSATGQGYSIQDANVLGFTPQGFSGHIIYPNSVYLADLIISFSQTLTDFSIMYSCQELGCDDAATMRVTAYMSGNFIGTSTRTATFPGTWPVDTLSCNFPQGFDSVVVHYDSPPPLCQDYGVIYMADNMRVTSINNAVINPKILIENLIVSNSASGSTVISFSLPKSTNLRVTIHDISGRLVKDLFNGYYNSGAHQLNWNTNDNTVKAGFYILNVTSENSSKSYKIILEK